MIGNFLSGRFSRTARTARMMITGSLTIVFGVALSLVLFAAGLHHPISLFGPVAIFSIGHGMTFSNSNAGVVSIYPASAGFASGCGVMLVPAFGALVFSALAAARVRRGRF